MASAAHSIANDTAHRFSTDATDKLRAIRAEIEAPKVDFGELDGLMGDAHSMADIVNSLVEGELQCLYKTIRESGGCAMVWMSEAQIDRISYAAGQCVFLTRQLRDEYYLLLNASKRLA